MKFRSCFFNFRSILDFFLKFRGENLFILLDQKIKIMSHYNAEIFTTNKIEFDESLVYSFNMEYDKTGYCYHINFLTDKIFEILIPIISKDKNAEILLHYNGSDFLYWQICFNATLDKIEMVEYINDPFEDNIKVTKVNYYNLDNSRYTDKLGLSPKELFEKSDFYKNNPDSVFKI